MAETVVHEYYRGRWPDEPIPDGEPTWLFYEVDRAAGAVLRTVEVFADGHVARNSIALEERHGDKCLSLIDMPLDDLIPWVDKITPEQFEEWWTKGKDTPFWFVR